jgi:hypothetical protein
MAKTGRTLTELAQEIERQANAKQDYIAPSTKLQMLDSNALIIPGHGEFEPNSIASGQLAEYTGIPMNYYTRMRAEQPQLLAANVNTWLQAAKADRRMLRTMDGKLRAFLSDKFRTLDNVDIGENILPILLDMDLMIISCEITERRLYIKAVHRQILKDVPTGRKMGDASHVFFDTVAPAITVSNSEVGMGRLLVESGVYTKACTNLAMIGAHMKRNHVGARNELSDDVYALLTDETKRATDAATWGQVRDVVRGAFQQAQFDAMCDKLSGAAQDAIPRDVDVVKVVEKFGRNAGLTEPVRKSILAHLIEGADLSRYGMHAAVTRASQDVEDYDTATDMERLGGSIIELPRNAWQEMLKVAA